MDTPDLFINSKNSKSKSIKKNNMKTQPKILQFFTSTSAKSVKNNVESLLNESQKINSDLDPQTVFDSVKSTSTPSYDHAESLYKKKSKYFFNRSIQNENENEQLTEESQSHSDLRSDQGTSNVEFDYKDCTPYELCEEQQRVIDLIFKEKKNVFFTGSAGTGKSLIIREIIHIAKSIQYTGRANKLQYNAKANYVAVTASTGLAAFHLGGSTLHSFAGIGLGTNTAEKLAENVLRNKLKRKKWRNVELLIIDEVSMLDGELFDKLEFIARKVRGSTAPFGGIQLVISGDFFQLPPVQKDASMKFAFEASTWDKCIQETVVLQKIYRQKDPELSRMLNEARLGQLTQSSIDIFESLSRPLNMEDGLDPTQLFPTRMEVDNFNSYKLGQLPGDTYRYMALDIGEDYFKNQLNSACMLPEVLDLKLGSQVMLLKNISSKSCLVNGLIGKVVGFDPPRFHTDDTRKIKEHIDFKRLYPRVKFINNYEYVCTPEEATWEINGELKASRIQVPLGLSWALSIHKAQGQTLHKVKIDLAKVFEKGQAYVALSRCTTVEGLQVLNFNHLKVKAHPRVIEYYAKHQT